MDIINECYISNLDLSELERYIVEHGTMRTLGKNKFLLKQNCPGYIMQLKHFRSIILKEYAKKIN